MCRKIAAGMAGLILFLFAGSQAAFAGDDQEQATPVRIGETTNEDISTYGESDGEPMTATGPGACPGPDDNSYVEALHTAWFLVPPTGRRLTATIDSFQPLIVTNYAGTAIFQSGDPLFCAWRVPDSPIDDLQFDFDAPTNRVNLLQIGQCKVTHDPPAADECAGWSPTALNLTVTSAPPGNDNRRSAKTVTPTPGQQIFDNHGAGTETGERATCTQGGATMPLRSSVWFRYVAPRFGTATFTAAPQATDPLKPVVQVYAGSSTGPSACNRPGGESPAKVTLRVAKGAEYLVQVASDTGSSSTAPQGRFDFDASFTTTDGDNDGEGDATDCAPDDPSRHHGAVDIYNNGIDEDCSGRDNLDADNDRHEKSPPGDDCDDFNPSIYPGANEILGDTIDQNCNHIAEPGELPRVNIDLKANHHSRGKLIFGKVRVGPVEPGYRIAIKCKPRHKKGCPKRGITKTVRKGHSFQSRYTFAKVLSNGAAFEVSVTWPGHNDSGVVKRFSVKRGHLRQRTCALVPRDPSGSSFRRSCR